jgi:imidazolonepropionase-like amidohydrolase
VKISSVFFKIRFSLPSGLFQIHNLLIMPKKTEIINNGSLVDAHIHIEDAQGLEDVIAAGVGEVRDAGTRNGAGLGVRRNGLRGAKLLVVSAGRALSKEGGYGSRFGRQVGTREEITSEIERHKRDGAGIIKIMASGIVSLNNHGRITRGGFTAEEIEYIVDEAARLGLAVMAHANGEAAIISAAKAGVRSIEHGFFMTRRSLEVLAEAGTFWTPTVGALARAAGSSTASAEAMVYVRGLLRTHLDMIGQAHAMGIPLAIGTDCVLPCSDYKKAYAAELSYFEVAGISREMVMRVAAEGGRKLLGPESKGEVSSGKGA